MQVWLVDEKSSSGAQGLEALLRCLEARAGCSLRLLGASQFHPDFADAMAKLVPDLLDLLVVNEAAWPEGPWTISLLSMGLGMVVVGPTDRVERFRALAEEFSLVLVPPDCGADGLWLALVNAHTALRRECRLKEQVTSLNQRLSDRIVIERAKGILIQMHNISEEEAYKRLQLFSRHQRRKIRDIAQSVLEMKCLFAPDLNGTGADRKAEQGSTLPSAVTGKEEAPSPLVATDSSSPSSGLQATEAGEG
jgi:ANTAR domain